MPNFISTDSLSRAVEWAERCSNNIIQNGTPLNESQILSARKIGVSHPERIRILTVDQIPLPDDPELLEFTAQYNILGPSTVGITFGYGIYICHNHCDVRILTHEFRHVYQHEQAGSLEVFLKSYIQQIIQYGYKYAPLEIDARQYEADI